MRPLLSLSNSEPATVVRALAGLLLVDMLQWSSDEGRRLPGLLESGIQYVREKRDTWRDLFSTFAVFSFDCEDASTVYAAEGRIRGNHPFVEVYAVRVTPRLIHIYNGDGKGNFFDVSKERGMRVPPSVDLPSMYRRGVKCPL